MQTINPPTTAQLLAPGQQPLMKVEIYVVAAWINLCDLAGENYVKDVSVSLGGASMTPNPVGGSWSVEIANENGIFHPQHPTSAYKTYLETGRLTRISIGATYGGVDYYWQRIIGHMDVPKFNAPDYSVRISGGDYMKRLQDAEVRFPDNYWGSSELFSSIESGGVGNVELYDEADAMTIVPDEVNDIPGTWVKTNCTFVSVADPRTGSAGNWSGEANGDGGSTLSSLKNLNVSPGVEGNSHQVRFWHRRAGGDPMPLRIYIYQDAGVCFQQLYLPTDTWKEEVFVFTARDNSNIQMWFTFPPKAVDIRLDDFSIMGFKYYYYRYYDIADANEKGPYRVILDTGGGFEDVWQAEEDEGWWYNETNGRVFFDINKEVAEGVDNLRIYYFLTTPIEEVLADLLYMAGVPDTNGDLYADAAAVLAAIEAAPGYVDPAIDIDKTWFEAGTTYLNAVKKICERCDYRFYFDYDGTPVFRPQPGVTAADFTLTDPKHVETVETYQELDEIKNRIVIKGLKQTSHINKDETVSSEYKGELADDGGGGSIELYGERALTINNHLFQDQTSIDNMCTSLLAKYKDPKWYADLVIPFNPVPLELSDNIQWEERLSPVLDITPSPEGIIRDVKIDNYRTTYKCVKKCWYRYFGDAFDDDLIGPEWTRFGEGAGRTIVETGGVITLAITAGTDGQWWCTISNNAPRVYMELPPIRPIIIETKLNAHTVNSFSHAGLMIARAPTSMGTSGIDPAYAYFIGRYKCAGSGLNGIYVMDQCGNNGGISGAPWATLPQWYRIEIDVSNNVTFYGSPDGISWTEIWGPLAYNYSPLYVGLVCMNWWEAGTYAARSAPFEDFYIDTVSQ